MSEQTSLRPVAVALAERSSISDTITLSGEFRPFQEVDVHAKVAGYIRKIYVDVGDHVKTGQTLAILEIPELDAQLQGASAAIRRSRDAVRRAKSDSGSRRVAASGHSFGLCPPEASVECASGTHRGTGIG